MKRIAIVLVAMLVFSISAVAQEDRAPSVFFGYTALNSTGCADNQTKFAVARQLDGPQYYVGTLVKANKIRMDESAAISASGYLTSSWGLYSNINHHDRMQKAFPIPVNTPVTVESTLYTENYEPVWRSIATISKCNGGALNGITNFMATELLENNSFETAAGDFPESWSPNADAIASTDTARDCSMDFKGACSLQVYAMTGLKQKITQNWIGIEGNAGQRIEFSVLQTVTSNYEGGGRILIDLTFANGTKQQLTILAEGAVNNGWHMSTVGLTMPSALTGAKITIKQKNSAGAWYLDNASLAIYRQRNLPPEPLSRGIALAPHGSYNGE